MYVYLLFLGPLSFLLFSELCVVVEVVHCQQTCPEVSLVACSVHLKELLEKINYEC